MLRIHCYVIGAPARKTPVRGSRIVPTLVAVTGLARHSREGQLRLLRDLLWNRPWVVLEFLSHFVELENAISPGSPDISLVVKHASMRSRSGSGYDRNLAGGGI